MASTSAKLPGTAATVTVSIPTPWVDYNNAKASDDTYTSFGQSIAGASSKQTDWLRLTNFGFTAGDVPAGNLITGITVTIHCKADLDTSRYVIDHEIYLRTTSGQVGDNKASSNHWPTSEAAVEHGGLADTWNANLSYSDVIGNANFGVDIRANLVNSASPSIVTALIDAVTIALHHAPPADTFIPHGCVC